MIFTKSYHCDSDYNSVTSENQPLRIATNKEKASSTFTPPLHFCKKMLQSACPTVHRFSICTNSRGFAESRPVVQRPAAQGTFRGPLHSSHPAVQCRILPWVVSCRATGPRALGPAFSKTPNSQCA